MSERNSEQKAHWEICFFWQIRALGMKLCKQRFVNFYTKGDIYWLYFFMKDKKKFIRMFIFSFCGNLLIKAIIHSRIWMQASSGNDYTWTLLQLEFNIV